VARILTFIGALVPEAVLAGVLHDTCAACTASGMLDHASGLQFRLFDHYPVRVF
jgi:hypothetical protein